MAVLTTFVAVSVINAFHRGPCEPPTRSNLAIVPNESAHFSKLCFVEDMMRGIKIRLTNERVSYRIWLPSN